MDFSLFPRDVFAELERLQRQMQQAGTLSPSIRGYGQSGYPAINVAGTEDSVEVYAFAPGLDPAAIQVVLDRGVLSISGERASSIPESAGRASVHMQERFSGRFHRVISLTDDLDPNEVAARYTDGVLHVSIRRKESAKPRRVTVN